MLASNFPRHPITIKWKAMEIQNKCFPWIVKKKKKLNLEFSKKMIIKIMNNSIFLFSITYHLFFFVQWYRHRPQQPSRTLLFTTTQSRFGNTRGKNSNMSNSKKKKKVRYRTNLHLVNLQTEKGNKTYSLQQSQRLRKDWETNIAQNIARLLPRRQGAFAGSCPNAKVAGYQSGGSQLIVRKISHKSIFYHFYMER